MSDTGRFTDKGQRTRERIVSSAAELVMAQGVSTITLEEVKAAAGVGNSQLYHYFADKSALLEAVIAHLTEQIVVRQEALLTTIEVRDDLRRWRDAVLEVQQTIGPQSGCPIGSLGSEIAQQDETARQAVARSLDRWQAALRAGLVRLQTLGQLRADADADALAANLMTALQGGLLLGKIHRSTEPLAQALDAAIDHVDAYAPA